MALVSRTGVLNHFLILCCLASLAGTISSCTLLWGTDRDKNGQREVTNVEIQEDVHRVATQVMARVSQTLKQMHGDHPGITEFAIQRELLYNTSVINIASQSMPEISLLDMMVFLRLSANVLKTHWIPRAFVPFNKRDVGLGLLETFRNAEASIAQSARKVMSDEEIQTIWRLTDRWTELYPNQFRVEQIRFSNFAQTAGEISEAGDIDLGGIMGSVRKALSTADEAILMSNRVMFLAQRMPFLLRLHARLATGGIISSAANQAETIDEVNSQMSGLRPLVNDASTLASNTKGAAQEGQELIKVFRENFPQKAEGSEAESASPEKILSGANDLTSNMLTLLREFKETGEGGIVSLLNIWQIAFAALFVGAGWAFFWWSGYLLAKRYLLNGASGKQLNNLTKLTDKRA